MKVSVGKDAHKFIYIFALSLVLILLLFIIVRNKIQNLRNLLIDRNYYFMKLDFSANIFIYTHFLSTI